MSRPLAFQEAKVRDEASHGSTRLVSLVSACCGGGWGGATEGGGLGEQPPPGRGDGGERVRLVRVASGAAARMPLDAFCTFPVFWREKCDQRVLLDRGSGVDGISRGLAWGRWAVTSSGDRGVLRRHFGNSSSVAGVALLVWSGCVLRASFQRTWVAALEEAEVSSRPSCGEWLRR